MSQRPRRRPRPVLLMSGRRRHRQYLARFRGKELWLTAGQFSLLCDLIVARWGGAEGFLAASPLRICVLRKAIDLAVGRKSTGKRVIETEGDSEYLLTIPASVVVVDRRHFEKLAGQGVISHEVMQTILRRCRHV